MDLYLVIIVCLILAAFTVWKEYKGGKQRLGWRITASLLAVISLACIALPVSYQGEKRLAINEAVLLTDGFNSDSLASLKGDSLLTIDPGIKKEYAKVKLITADQLRTLSPVVTRLHIFGNGLNNAELSELDSIPVVFHSSPQSLGINAINWTDRLKQGQQFKVQGSFNNTSGKLVRLMLKGLSTNVDSVVIAPKSTLKFDLTDQPKGLGQSVYHLLAVNDKDTVTNETLPLIIDPVKPLKILLLAAAPNFEDKFLKNWLTQNGFAVAIRSAISKNKISSEYVNIGQTPLNNLSASLLDKFDVLIGDLSVIHALNNSESAVLKQQVNQKGLGLIVKADTVFGTASWVQNNFPLKKAIVKDAKPLSLNIEGKKISSATPAADQLFINYGDVIQTLVNDGQNRVLAGFNIAGSGRIVFTTLNETYSWMLAGEKSDYTKFWSLLISKAARSVPQSELWQTASGVPSVNEPVQLSLETSAQAGQITVDSVILSPKQNYQLPFQFSAPWWPANAGWHNPKMSGVLPGSIYVYNETAWKTIRAIGKTAATKKYAESFGPGVNVTKQIHQKTPVPVPKGYFYVLLLLACTWLWVEGKARPQTSSSG